jgi:hypothetical protein
VAKESASQILSIDGLFLSISYPVDSDSFKGWMQRFPAGTRFEITVWPGNAPLTEAKVNARYSDLGPLMRKLKPVEYQAETDDTWSLQEIEAGAQADRNECNAEEPNPKHMPGDPIGDQRSDWPESNQRVKVMIQFVSQVLPASSENACSKRLEFAVMAEKPLRVMMTLPSNSSWS